MKAVLISIQPKWVEKIASGEKTIEVRKSVPKLERPFKVYIYETQGKQVEHLNGCDITYHGRGKVIGEFVCRGMMDGGSSLLPKQSCLTIDEIFDYAKGKRVYGWRIADLKIYDKPKELREFITPTDCKSVIAKDMLCNTCCICSYFCTKKPNRITRPPQSWCYVEFLKELQE